MKYLPEKFNEIMSLLSNKEIRVRLPVEELDMLLEPIKSKNQVAEEEDSSDENEDNNNKNDLEVEDNYKIEDMEESEEDSCNDDDDENSKSNDDEALMS